MTNRERLISLLGFTPTDDAVTGALIDAGISEGARYEATASKMLKQCAIELLRLLLSTPDTTNENGFSQRYDRAAIERRIVELSGTAGRPTISSSKVW